MAASAERQRVAGAARAAGAATSRRVGVVLLAAGAAVAASGCVSTQQKNARAQLSATRELSSREPQRVRGAQPGVRVARVAVVRGRRFDALVVELRSRARTPLTDVPIAVGVRTRDGRRVLLNGRRHAWFQTHVPALPAGGNTTWVFTAGRRGVPAGRPFAVVGATPRTPISKASSLPRIVVAPARDGGDGGGARGARSSVARVVVANASDVPQRDVQVYALVRDRHRYVAAGKAAVAELGAGDETAVRIPLSGPAPRRTATVHALPTIFE
ncbi:hypothetical protein VSS74_30060 [Conexibacter stalactiti]|uniref:Uncharacterized protein n=1 Tax=Conexibacter stalactiti TaxID=1940611 RepID=A0ABU4HZV0_9ACTN|nr:hypothetical protein [Conexibacter stalactiti]MDW5598644.1 hypothetical protein [Conexibacter stalactiti]MEC5039286.1 hypothetical protein [Conexibacter stalactiti]